MQARARETKAAITAAAGRVFGRDGFARAALTDICTAAGVTSGALYFHFDSKDALAQSVLSEYDAEMRVFCDQLLSRSGSPLENMLFGSFSWGRRLVEDPIVAGGVRLSLERSDLLVRSADVWDPWVETVVTLLSRAREIGEVSTEIEVIPATGFLLAGFAGTQIISREYAHHADLDDRLIELWYFSLAGILPRAEGGAVDTLIARARHEVETQQSPPLRRDQTA